MSGKCSGGARLFLIVLVVAALSIARASAQAPTTTNSTIGVTPRVAGGDVSRQLRVQGMRPHVEALGVLIDPFGNETPLFLLPDANGTATLTLYPPVGGWSVGMYRTAIDIGGGQSVSATFVASDGQPHLIEAETLPSPFSAFNVDGTGLPPNSSLDLTLYLAGQLAQRTFHVTTDADGTLTMFIWPQQFGFTFFSAGTYRLVASVPHVEADWVVREHPVSSSLTVKEPVIPATGADVTFASYLPRRLLWVVYARMDGVQIGEALVGPTDLRGVTVAHVPIPVSSGAYLMATPYDWGETLFTVLPPTATSTPTPAPTATSTATPTATSTSVPCFLALKLSHAAVKVGKQQTVRISTVPNATVDVTVRFPSKNQKHRAGIADASGAFTWSYTQPANRTTRTSSSARVVATTICSDGSLKESRVGYRIR